MSEDKSAEAREGLLDGVAGKAKEVLGAVRGRDDLVEEGQLQQAEAARRKDAVAQEALAEAERVEAAEDLGETNAEVARDEATARAEAQRVEADAELRRDREHVVAARDAAREEASGRASAEADADRLAETRLEEAAGMEADADATERESADEAERLEREAAAEERVAAQLRGGDRR